MEEGDREVEFKDLHSLLLTAEDEDAQAGRCVLPPHHRCSSYTLNLIANNEIDKWLSTDPESRVVYRSATAQCSALWTKTSTKHKHKYKSQNTNTKATTEVHQNGSDPQQK